ncbi:TPA: hypothetical protein N0F65_009841 [Lagenidium giganteum]|uniref:Myb/SANT-like domain-containing protein n=1 Tax=Lagenidium giganteum TaxID=4803 RepID=A0AAV2YKL3_9STRA|nr:TPA: hypothetical protein N0F65_009841 [Lagenidium giganteum]
MRAPKGKNFSTEEEQQLCTSYLAISKDATGTNQSASFFWERVTAHFNASRSDGADQRPYRSLECKWHTIQHDVSKFWGYVATVRDLKVFGANVDDEIEHAMTMFMETQASAFDSCIVGTCSRRSRSGKIFGHHKESANQSRTSMEVLTAKSDRLASRPRNKLRETTRMKCVLESGLRVLQQEWLRI